MAFNNLKGACVLVVEDEYLLAAETSDGLIKAGARVVGPAANLDAALKLMAEERIDAAIVDVNLRDALAYPLIDILLARNIPVVMATGYDAGAIPLQYAHIVRCEKPVGVAAIIAALSNASAPAN